MGKRYAEAQMAARVKKQRVQKQVLPGFAAKVEKVMRSKEECKDILATTGVVGVVPNATPILYPISLVACGTDATERIGRKISYKSMQLCMTCTAVSTQVTNGCFWVIFDRQPNGSAATFFNVFTTLGSTGYGKALRNTQQFHERFQILSKKEVVLTGTVGNNDTTMKHDLFIPLDKVLKGRDRTQNFNSTTAVIGAVDTGCIYVCFATDGGAVANCTWECFSKVRFIDA